MPEDNNFTKTTYVGGNYLEIIKGNKIDYVKKHEVHSNKQIIKNAKGGTISKEPTSPPKKVSKTRVKEIELITPLNMGSKNDGSGVVLQEGFIYGKTYEFKVKNFTNGNPISNQLIKWMYKYHNLSTDKWVEVHSKIRGGDYALHFNEKEMCGRFIHVRAYIDDEESEGELKTWHHNRFRWLDRSIVETEIKERTDNKKPWLINQGGTSLCGMACVFYLFAKEQPNDYKKFAIDLFRTGEAKFNKYMVKPSIEVLEKKVNINGFPLNTANMPLVDYITLAGTRNTSNPSYKGGDEEFQAINWPPLMTTLSEKLLGYLEVSSNGVYNPIPALIYTSYDIENKIKDINEQFNAGYKLILMIDSDLINDVWDYDGADLHWIVLESEIKEVQMINNKGEIEYLLDFNVYTWGEDPFGIARYLKRPISKNHFMNNYNGYIKVK